MFHCSFNLKKAGGVMKSLLTAKTVSNLRRFKSVSDTKRNQLKTRLMKKRTFNKMQWAVNLFKEWCSARLSRPETFDVKLLELDIDLVSTMTKERLCFALCRFVPEITKKDGSDYPGKTLCEIIVAIQKHVNHKDLPWKLINDPAFLDLKMVLDNVMK